MDSKKNENWEKWTHSQNWKQQKCQVFWANYIHINFQKKPNGLNNRKGPENIYYTIVKYGETFYGRHTALIPAVVEINRF